ncbi:hypothetical protein [Streptomyces sp. bgisy029]|uniref:hypothetical protein n=1 Tax=Streptomyces sp. bgisy029 TaxID=3413771 RepID=UPI003D71E7DB
MVRHQDRKLAIRELMKARGIRYQPALELWTRAEGQRQHPVYVIKECPERHLGLAGYVYSTVQALDELDVYTISVEFGEMPYGPYASLRPMSGSWILFWRSVGGWELYDMRVQGAASSRSSPGGRELVPPSDMVAAEVAHTLCSPPAERQARWEAGASPRDPLPDLEGRLREYAGLAPPRSDTWTRTRKCAERRGEVAHAC